MQSSIFLVHEEPYCIWEVDIPERNNEFLDGIDTDFFNYIVETNSNADDEKRASIALRSALYHAMETMFSLLGAYIQAPDCTYAWIAKCSNSQLRDLVEKIKTPNNNIFTKLNIEEVSWDCVTKSVFQCYMPGTEKNETMVKEFSTFLNRTATEFIKKNHIDEYNSLKHGFRVRSGGFSLSLGTMHEYGVSPPEEKMMSLGKSDYGTSFFTTEAIGKRKGNRSIRSRRASINWSIENTILHLQLISMAIGNITSALKVANGAKAGTCQFHRPQQDSDFQRPWSITTGISSCNMDYVIHEEEIITATKSEILEKIGRVSKI